MTDRISHLTVALEADMRDDDVQVIVDAISLLRGVSGVTLGKPVSIDDHMARHRVGQMVAQQLFDIGHALLRGNDPRSGNRSD